MQAKGLLQFRVRPGLHTEVLNVYRIGDYGNLRWLNAATDDIVSQPLTDGGDGIGATKNMAFHAMGQPVANTQLPAGTVINGGILPESTAFINQWQAKFFIRLQCCQTI